MTRESLISVSSRSLSLIYGFGSIWCTAKVLFSGVSVSLPESIDPSLVIGPSLLACGALLQAVVVCSFLVAIAETLGDTDEVSILPDPPRDRVSAKSFVDSPKQAVA